MPAKSRNEKAAGLLRTASFFLILLSFHSAHTRRGIRILPGTYVQCGRSIPTPVGNTGRRGLRECRHTVHPHTRGEHLPRLEPSIWGAGPSPHPWGTHLQTQQGRFRLRSIPTPVGNTPGSTPGTRAPAVHPHTRGEHPVVLGGKFLAFGPSPHPWGTLEQVVAEGEGLRSIPTPVGNTWCTSSVPRATPVHPHTRGEHVWGENFA